MPTELRLPLAEYRRKVYASWIGQCVGNMFGLGYENVYLDEPMPEGETPAWKDWVLDLVRQADGAFSDDDTDIEYLYLLAMEESGEREVTYEELARRWMHHVRSHVWVANRAALGLMHHGLRPPLTGRRGVNPHGFQIDPQLVNEIWGVTAPGMARYAADKSAWAARVMADGWGIEPTIHYGVMYAAAFFERDVRRLVDLACDCLPEGGRFAGTVAHMRRLHEDHPVDWRRARRELCETYYHGEPAATRTIWNANLNGACGVLALLYGEGDFRRTLEMCCRIGFDVDNQAATMCGLVAIVTGIEGIPADLLNPLPDRAWSQPLNDRYHNRTRFDLPDARLTDLAARIAAQGERVVLRAGGRVERDGAAETLVIPSRVGFHAPSEPAPSTEQTSSTGLGRAPGENLAWSAARIASHAAVLDEGALSRMIVFTPRALLADSVTVIRDQAPLPAWPGPDADPPLSFYGFLPGGADASIHHGGIEAYYGYEWTAPVTIGRVLFRTGTLEEIGGWFIDPRVEMRDEAGAWRAVRDAQWRPGYPAGEEPLTKAPWVQYEIQFAPVAVSGIRMIGRAAGGFASVATVAVFRA
ncbi:MAG: hypothetical protein FLDDKLPJ_01310 [Phycisphaerae bacterium]|nr:hypothetical protein [Phycisphaerae bacterium]